MDVVPTPQQDRALQGFITWFRSRSPEDQVFRLFGYAGSGKTTLARRISEEIGGKILFAAFTGKAALVLDRKGCKGASTLHQLIYTPVTIYACLAHPDKVYTEEEVWALDRRCSQCKRELKEIPCAQFMRNEESPLVGARLLILDECSMVYRQLGLDAMSFGVPILVLGDPFQLPPVKNDDVGFFTNHQPNAMLTEVLRHGPKSAVYHMAMLVREQGRLPAGDYGSSKVTAKYMDDVVGQMLVGLNRTRTGYNDIVRQRMGFASPFPVKGDRLVCVRNNHFKKLLNGSLWDVRTDAKLDDERYYDHFKHCDVTEPVLNFAITSADGDTNPHGEIRIMASTSHPDFFQTDHRELAKERAQLFRRYDAYDYGYALTVHKAQGSQWPVVTLRDESSYWNRERDLAQRWLYTGITRAEEQAIVVRGNPARKVPASEYIDFG